jgi:hypothetical protein
MAKGLSAAQRRAVTGSDPATGRLSARPQVCTALVAAGLAVPHGRSGHHYLTPEGLRVRAALAEAERAGPPPGVQVPGVQAPGGGFVADDGAGAVMPGGGAGRAAEVAAAWEGLLQIRAVLLDGVRDVPAPWERERCVHAVSLALEALGCPPAHPDGYVVTPSSHPTTAHVTWTPTPAAPTALPRIARLLTPYGWQSTHHRTRDAHPYLLVTPHR